MFYLVESLEVLEKMYWLKWRGKGEEELLLFVE